MTKTKSGAKLKTNSGATKRFRKTASGLKFRRALRNHILTKKTHKRKRHLKAMGLVCAADENSIVRLLHGS